MTKLEEEGTAMDPSEGGGDDDSDFGAMVERMKNELSLVLLVGRESWVAKARSLWKSSLAKFIFFDFA